MISPIPAVQNGGDMPYQLIFLTRSVVYTFR